MATIKICDSCGKNFDNLPAGKLGERIINVDFSAQCVDDQSWRNHYEMCYGCFNKLFKDIITKMNNKKYDGNN